MGKFILLFPSEDRLGFILTEWENTMAKKKIYCSVDGCFEERHYVSSGLCKACYAGMHYWKGASPTRILKRVKQLARLSSRMDTMMPTVRSITRRRRRRA